MRQLAAVIASSICLSGFAGVAHAQGWRVSSDQTVGGFKFPESAAYDAKGKVLYVGNFGGDKLAPAEKDGQGYISKVGLNGKVIEERWVPVKGGPAMNKPKGIWIQGERLWVTDIDAVWIFDTKTKKGRRLALPGVVFANDPAVMGKALYISDNRADKLVKVEPADFLNAKNDPEVVEVVAGMGLNPNGIYPSRTGILYLGGSLAPDKPKALYALGVSGQIKDLSEPFGRIDGLYEMADGSLLYTNWDNGMLWHRTEAGIGTPLAAGFKGPADFTVIPIGKDELTVVVPDLVLSHLRFIHLRRQ